jgi:GTPase SAR1 family protein
MSETKKPITVITIGMAGAGKSTFVQRINSYLHSISKPPYIINLDPAVTNVPFDANIDIRDTVNYQEVMKRCVIGHSFMGLWP